MVYFKVLLNNKRLKSDNIYPIVIRVTHNRNNTTFSTGIRVHSNQWDDKSYKIKHSHPSAQILNKSISDIYNKLQNASIKLINEQNFSFEELKKSINNNHKYIKNKPNYDFNSYARQLIKDLFAANKAGNGVIYQTATNRLMGYAGTSKLKFSDIDYTFLDGFNRQLIKDGVRQNSISNYFRTIRAIYNKAIKEKLIDRSHYPFRDITIKTERTAKRALSLFDLIKIANVELKVESPMWKARNYFLLSFTLMGISFTDLAYLNVENIKKGRLIYKRKKTGQELNIKLHPFSIHLLNILRNQDMYYLLPILQQHHIEGTMIVKKLIAQWIKTTNKYLCRLAKICQIDSEVTTYVTRHSWATTAKKSGYSLEMIADGLGHEYGNKITNIYLDKFDQSALDIMNDLVILNIISCSKQVNNAVLFTKSIPQDLNRYKQFKTPVSIYLKYIN